MCSARGQQLRNCIPVGIHLNLIRGTWPRINQSQCSFCWVKVYVYNKIVCLTMWSLRMWFATLRLHTASLLQAMRSIDYASPQSAIVTWGRLAVCSRASQTTSEVTTSWDKRLSFSFEIITLVTTCTLQTRVDSEVTRSKLTSNLLGSFGKGGGRMAPRHQISLCAWNSGSSKKKSIKLYECIIPPERFMALWGRASMRTGTEAFPDVCDQPLTENLKEIKKHILTGAFIQFFNSSLSFTSTLHLRFTQTVFITVKLDYGRDEAEPP